MNDAFAKTITYGFILIIGAAISSPEFVTPFTIALGIVLGIELGNALLPDGKLLKYEYILEIWLGLSMTIALTGLFTIIACMSGFGQISSVIGFTVSTCVTTLIRRWTK